MKNNYSSCFEPGIDYRKDVLIPRQEAVICKQPLAYLWKPLQYFTMFTEEILVVSSALVQNKNKNRFKGIVHSKMIIFETQLRYL